MKAAAHTTADFASNPPVDPAEVAARFGARVSLTGGGRRADQLTNHGQLSVEDGRWHIRIPRELQSARRRFSAAHEIGHILLFSAVADHPALIRELRSSELHTTVERLCDWAAANILMPATSFDRELGRPPRIDGPVIEALATRFKVSLEAAARRIPEVAQEWSVVFWEYSTGHPRGPAWRTSKQQHQRGGGVFLPPGLSSSRLEPDVVNMAAHATDARADTVIADLPGIRGMMNVSAWHVPAVRNEIAALGEDRPNRQADRVFVFYQAHA